MSIFFIFDFFEIKCFLAIIATIGFSRPQIFEKVTYEKIAQFLAFW